MIWVGGRVVPDESLTIGALDRAFEHGLGLFETFRTWGGHATLLARHLARLVASARELALPLDPAALPDAGAVAALRAAEGIAGDCAFRLTTSGGRTERDGPVVWLRALALPANEPEPYAVGYAHVLTPDDPGDGLARHKTLNYWARRRAYEAGRRAGWDEVLSRGAGGEVFEGTRTNLFAIFGVDLLTPPSSRPLLPGVMRGLVLERADRVGLRPREAPMDAETLGRADEVFLTNAVRGVVPVRRVSGRDYVAPGPRTRRLRDDLRAWLEAGGTTP